MADTTKRVLNRGPRTYDLRDGSKLLPNGTADVSAEEAKSLCEYGDVVDASSLSHKAAAKADHAAELAVLKKQNKELQEENDKLRAESGKPGPEASTEAPVPAPAPSVAPEAAPSEPAPGPAPAPSAARPQGPKKAGDKKDKRK